MSWKFLSYENIVSGCIVRCIDNPNRKLGPKSDNNGCGSGWVLHREFIARNSSRDRIIWPRNGGNGVYKDCLEVVRL